MNIINTDVKDSSSLTNRQLAKEWGRRADARLGISKQTWSDAIIEGSLFIIAMVIAILAITILYI